MKRWLTQHQDRLWVLLVIFAVVTLHVLVFGNKHVADDTYFANALNQRTLAEFAAFRYVHWSGRIPIEIALALLVNHAWLWKLLNSLMVLLLAYSAGRISLARTGMSTPASTALAFALFMLISPAILYEAVWWITGSINYLWPVALGLFGLLAFVEPKNHGHLMRLAFLLASGLAMYNEQVALVLLPVCALLLSLRVAQRQWRGWDLAHVGFMILNALIVFCAPGSHRRYLSEQGLRFPDFATLDVLDKVAIGFGLVFRSVIDPDNLLVGVLIVFCLMQLLRSPVGKLARTMILLALGYLALNYVLIALDLLDGSARSAYVAPVLDGASASSSRAYALSAWFAFTVACLVGGCAIAFWRSLRECSTTLLTLLLGLASLVAMGFSPTAYASGSRVHFVCQIAFLLVAARMIVAFKEEFSPRTGKAMFLLIGLAASYRVLRLLY